MAIIFKIFQYILKIASDKYIQDIFKIAGDKYILGVFKRAGDKYIQDISIYIFSRDLVTRVESREGRTLCVGGVAALLFVLLP